MEYVRLRLCFDSREYIQYDVLLNLKSMGIRIDVINPAEEVSLRLGDGHLNKTDSCFIGGFGCNKPQPFLLGFLVGNQWFVLSLTMSASVVSINISDKKGVRKKPVDEAVILTGYGIEGDAHASAEWHRQVSLLAIESIRKMQDMGLDVHPGDFAENITTEGVDLVSLPLGTRISVGEEVVGEVSQIGKECHTRCAIYYQAGDCVMPKEGIFIKVIKGGRIRKGDKVFVS